MTVRSPGPAFGNDPERGDFCLLPNARHEKLNVATRLAGPDLQSRTVLEKRTETPESKCPPASAFTEVPLGHKCKWRLTTHARQRVVAFVLTHVAATLCALSLAHKQATLGWASVRE